jgi:hypothetical protein
MSIGDLSYFANKARKFVKELSEGGDGRVNEKEREKTIYNER